MEVTSDINPQDLNNKSFQTRFSSLFLIVLVFIFAITSGYLYWINSKQNITITELNSKTEASLVETTEETKLDESVSVDSTENSGVGLVSSNTRKGYSNILASNDEFTITLEFDQSLDSVKYQDPRTIPLYAVVSRTNWDWEEWRIYTPERDFNKERFDVEGSNTIYGGNKDSNLQNREIKYFHLGDNKDYFFVKDNIDDRVWFISSSSSDIAEICVKDFTKINKSYIYNNWMIFEICDYPKNLVSEDDYFAQKGFYSKAGSIAAVHMPSGRFFNVLLYGPGDDGYSRSKRDPVVKGNMLQYTEESPFGETTKELDLRNFL